MHTVWKLGFFILTLLLAALFSFRASATSVTVTGSIGAGFLGDTYNRTGSIDTGGGVFLNNQGVAIPGLSITAQADSFGGAGFVRAHTFAGLIRDISDLDHPANAVQVNSDSYASATFNDVLVSGPVGGNVPTRLNLHIDGSFINGTTVDPLVDGVHVGTAANNFVGIAVVINNNFQNIMVASGNYYYASTDGSQPAEVLGASSGVLVHFNGSLDFQSDFFTVQSGVPFSVSFQLQTAAGVRGPDYRSVIVDANSNFSNTFSFATDRPVFSLPDGYTANSGDAGIVNNNFALPVPEPATSVMSATLLGLLGALSARKRLGDSIARYVRRP